MGVWEYRSVGVRECGRRIRLPWHRPPGQVFVRQFVEESEVLLDDFVPGKVLGEFARALANSRAQFWGGHGALNGLRERVRIIGRNQETIDCILQIG